VVVELIVKELLPVFWFQYSHVASVVLVVLDEYVT
jgi:hypothetical protein